MNIPPSTPTRIMIDLYRKAYSQLTRRELVPLKIGLVLVSLIATAWLGWALNDLRVVNHTRREAAQKLISLQPSVDHAEKRLAQTARLEALTKRLEVLTKRREGWRKPHVSMDELLGGIETDIKPTSGIIFTGLMISMEEETGHYKVCVPSVAIGVDPRAIAEAYCRDSSLSNYKYVFGYHVSYSLRASYCDAPPIDGSTKALRFIMDVQPKHYYPPN